MPDFDELSFENETTCPNCGEHVGGDTVCPNCGAILGNDEDDLDNFDQEEDI